MKQDYLAIVLRVIEEHHTIRGNIKLVGDSVNDLEAMFNLQNVYASWTQSSIDALAQKRDKLLQTFSVLDAGLRRHFFYEEKYLPPIFGEILIKALIMDHHEILRKIDEANVMTSGTSFEGLAQEELLAKKTQFQQALIGICKLNEDHLSREEVILGMTKRALEEEARSGVK
ncbi:MAG: hemerythrin domain-containing protein [Chloroflexi bacterium]|nr:hemerythrin domain-containing protein [Chloroflexota bacterium]